MPGAQPLRAPTELAAKILSERAGIQGERKQVTVMYTDVVGSMELTRALDAERWGFVLDRFLAIAAAAVHAYEGTVNQFTGDGLLAVFGAPLAHEDHARRACLAVLDLQHELGDLAAEVWKDDGVELAARCGLNSGEVIIGAIGDDVHMDFVPVGNTTALGKRIEELAPSGSTAISAATAALVEGEFEVRELGEFELKGAPEPQRVFELVGRGAAPTRLHAMAATRGLSEFVGRVTERAALEWALKQARAGRGRAVGIMGDAGVGKSRLVHEFVADCARRGLAVNRVAGVAHGRYLPFLPVLALFRDFFAIDEQTDPEDARRRTAEAISRMDPAFAADLPLLLEFLGVADPQVPQVAQVAPDPVAGRRRLLDVAIAVLVSRSHREPSVIVLEDLHWFDDASDGFLEELVEAVAGTRILLLTTYRPEYVDTWTESEPHDRLDLAPLGGHESEDLLTLLLGRHGSLDGLRSLVKARTGGNPFFIEEVVQALVENGRLTGERGSYRLSSEIADLTLPPSVEAGLAARIDRLPSREKALVQSMAVVGPEVPGPLLTGISDLDDSDLAEALKLLERRQWVVPRGRADRATYVFKHPLTQEVAYRSQLSDWRRRAHARVATTIESTYPDALDERAALIAHHHESAGDTASAAAWHARAADWARTASPAESMRHWRRVHELASGLDAGAEREELVARSRIGLLSLAWRLGMAPDETAAFHAAAYDDVHRSRADLYFSGSLMHGGREREGLEGFRAVHRQALAAGRSEVAFIASSGVAYAGWVAGDLRGGLEAIDQAVPLAGGDPRFGSGDIFVCPVAHVQQTRGLCRGYLGDLDGARADFQLAVELAREHGDAETVAAAHANHALLEASIGEHQVALDVAARGRAVAEQAANVVHIIACAVPTAVAQAGLGRFDTALALAETSLESVHQHRVGLYFEPLLLATVARSQLGLGQHDDALTAAQRAADIAESRGLGACGLLAPITLAQVLMADPGTAEPTSVDGLLSRALRLAHATSALVMVPVIRREQAAAARVWNDVTGHTVSG